MKQICLVIIETLFDNQFCTKYIIESSRQTQNNQQENNFIKKIVL